MASDPGYTLDCEEPLVRPTCALPHEHEEHHGSRGKGDSNELAARLSRKYGATKPR